MNIKTINLNFKINHSQINPFLLLEETHFPDLNFNFNYNNEPIIVFKNVFKFYSLQNSPIEFIDNQRNDWFEPICCMINMIKNLNLSIISYKSEHQAQPFIHIVKMQTNNQEHNRKSMKNLRGHTDGVAHRLPFENNFKNVDLSPDFIILTCLRNNNTATTITPINYILDELSFEEKYILSQPFFIATPQMSYNQDLPSIFPISVFNQDFSNMRFSHENIKVCDTNNYKAEQALKKLKDIVEKKQNKIILQSGDVALINNRNCLHGRSHPGQTINDQDRWIIRSYAMKNEHLINNNKELY